MLDGERLGDTENECARKMCTGGLMFVAAEDNVVLIEPRKEIVDQHLWSKVDTCGFSGATHLMSKNLTLLPLPPLRKLKAMWGVHLS